MLLPVSLLGEMSGGIARGDRTGRGDRMGREDGRTGREDRAGTTTTRTWDPTEQSSVQQQREAELET